MQDIYPTPDVCTWKQDSEPCIDAIFNSRTISKLVNKRSNRPRKDVIKAISKIVHVIKHCNKQIK